MTLSKGSSITLDWQPMGGTVSSNQWIPQSRVDCNISFIVLSLCHVVRDPMSVDQISCRPLNYGAEILWTDKANPHLKCLLIPASQGELLLLLAEQKGLRVVSWSPSSWWVSLKVMPYQNLALVSIAGGLGCLALAGARTASVSRGHAGPEHSLHPCYWDFSVYVTIMPALEWLITEASWWQLAMPFCIFHCSVLLLQRMMKESRMLSKGHIYTWYKDLHTWANSYRPTHRNLPQMPLSPVC